MKSTMMKVGPGAKKKAPKPKTLNMTSKQSKMYPRMKGSVMNGKSSKGY